MKRIRKGSEPNELRIWREALRPRNQVPAWSNFTDPARLAVRSRIAADQHQLCCYCTATIAAGNYHIEHFKPRVTWPQSTYRWTNLLASCQTYQRDSFVGEVIETQKHCGDAKGNWFEEGATTNPQRANVERLFRFPLTGKIAADKDLPDEQHANVERSISELNLNAPSLVARRRHLLALAARHVNEMAREEWVNTYIAQRADGSFQEFWPALRYNYDKLWSSRFT